MRQLRAGDNSGGLERWGEAVMRSDHARGMHSDRPGALTEGKPTPGSADAGANKADAQIPHLWDGLRGFGSDAEERRAMTIAQAQRQDAQADARASALMAQTQKPANGQDPRSAPPASANDPRNQAPAPARPAEARPQAQSSNGSPSSTARTPNESPAQARANALQAPADKLFIARADKAIAAELARTLEKGHEHAKTSGEPRANGTNTAERANISRFLRAPAGTTAAASKELAETLRRERDRELAESFGNARRRARAAEDARLLREEHGEQKAQSKERAGQKERAKEVLEEDLANGDDRLFSGEGWTREAREAEEEHAGHALREADALGEKARCRGTTDDGHRCLRHAQEGTPYCREHAVRVAWDATPRLEALDLFPGARKAKDAA